LSAAQLREYTHFTGTQVALLMGLLLSLLAALWLKKRMLYTLALLLSAGYLVQLLMR
jgi:predicted membrane metal-binding protein